jgi:hypothetical protein
MDLDIPVAVFFEILPMSSLTRVMKTARRFSAWIFNFTSIKGSFYNELTVTVQFTVNAPFCFVK